MTSMTMKKKNNEQGNENNTRGIDVITFCAPYLLPVALLSLGLFSTILRIVYATPWRHAVSAYSTWASLSSEPFFLAFTFFFVMISTTECNSLTRAMSWQYITSLMTGRAAYNSALSPLQVQASTVGVYVFCTDTCTGKQV